MQIDANFPEIQLNGITLNNHGMSDFLWIKSLLSTNHNRKPKKSHSLTLNTNPINLCYKIMDGKHGLGYKYINKIKLFYHILHRCGFPVFHNTQEQNSPSCKAAKKIMYINQMLTIKQKKSTWTYSNNIRNAIGSKIRKLNKFRATVRKANYRNFAQY